MMKFFKGILVFIVTSTYVSMLFLTASAISLRLTLGNPEVVKMWLSESGFYGGVVSEVSKLATIQQAQANTLVQITEEDIQGVARETFPEASLQTDAEKVIDGFYGWLKGETTGPEFSVDFTTRQTAFAESMTALLAQKVMQLPVCQNASTFALRSFDPFTAECRPESLNIEASLKSFKEELASSESLLPQLKFTGDDLKLKDGNGNPDRIGSVLDWVPNVYRIAMWSPIFLGGFTVLIALGNIFFTSSKRRGLKRFAGGLLFAGSILVITGLVMTPALTKLNDFSVKVAGGSADSLAKNVSEPLFQEVYKTYSRHSLITGVAYVVPALILYAALLLTRHKDPEAEPEELDVDSSVHAAPQHQPTEDNYLGDLAASVKAEEPYVEPWSNIEPEPEPETLPPQPAAVNDLIIESESVGPPELPSSVPKKPVISAPRRADLDTRQSVKRSSRIQG